MTRTFRIATAVLILPLVFAAGCSHAPKRIRNKRSLVPAPSTPSRGPATSNASETPSAERTTELSGSPIDEEQGAIETASAEYMAQSKGDDVEQTAAYLDASPEPVVVAALLKQPTLEDAVAERADTNVDAETADESAGFESVVSGSPLEPTQLATDCVFCEPIAESDPDSAEVAQTGCRLFCEKPPLRRQCIDLGLGKVSSIIDPCGMKYLAPYVNRVWMDASADESTWSDPAGTPGLPSGCPPPAWWEQQVVHCARNDSTAIPLDIESLLVRTLANSKYLQGLADLPVIRQKSTMEAIAEFDVTTFMETRFTRPSEPVGNELTVGPGGSKRFRENDFATSAGISRKTSYGGRAQLAQKIGLLTNNSTFIDPRHQGNAQLTLNLTQPLLSGAGKSYNTSLIMLAQMDERVAWDQVSRQLQDYLVEVTENYWQLYLERARLKQKERHLQRGEAILNEIEQRRGIDAVESQIARARAAVQTRRTEMIRAKTLVRNIESRLRGLVNDPQLYGSSIELVPAETPHCLPLNVSLGDAMSQALQSRSEIDESIQKVRAACVRLSVAKNELMPILDLVLETYLSGLRGSNDIGRAWVDQFSVGEPSYSAGVRYEIPFNNRMAKNRHQRRRVEMRQAISQFEFQVETLMSEVDIAVREVDTAYQELLSLHEAMLANELDLSYFQKRWELLPGDDRSASFLLEDILEAQDRVAAQESNFAQAQVNYAMSIVNLKRELGILMHSERIEMERACHCGLEKYTFRKEAAAIVPDVFVPADRHQRGPGQGFPIIDDPRLDPIEHPVMIEELEYSPRSAPAPTNLPAPSADPVPLDLPEPTIINAPTPQLEPGPSPADFVPLSEQ